MLHSYFSTKKLPSFSDFSDQDHYAGFVPSEHYLAEMLNKTIEVDEADGNQHTACIAPDQIAVDDSHKINKHIVKIDGVPIFTALWTCMDSKYIWAQTLTSAKAKKVKSHNGNYQLETSVKVSKSAPKIPLEFKVMTLKMKTTQVLEMKTLRTHFL